MRAREPVLLSSSLDQRLSGSPIGSSLLAAFREAVALGRQSLVMHRDLAPRVPADLAAGEHLVVLLHGLFATAGAMSYLRREIERRTPARTASFSYRPGALVHDLSLRLGRLLADAPAGVRVHLVGHSLGGVVSRYYVQVYPRDGRVLQTVSLASPFAGSRVAALVPRFLSREVEVGSPVLRVLARSWSATRVPHTSFVATHDQMVIPSESAAAPFGEVIRVSARAHNALLCDAAVADCVVERVQRLIDADQVQPAAALVA